jgi:hypothetical protein
MNGSGFFRQIIALGLLMSLSINCSGSGSTNSGSKAQTASTNAQLTAYTNPADGRFSSLRLSTGELITQLGSRDAAGLPKAITQVIITAANHDPAQQVTLTMDAKGRPVRAVLGDGTHGQMNFDWTYEPQVTVALTTGGQTVTSILDVSQIAANVFTAPSLSWAWLKKLGKFSFVDSALAAASPPVTGSLHVNLCGLNPPRTDVLRVYGTFTPQGPDVSKAQEPIPIDFVESINPGDFTFTIPTSPEGEVDAADFCAKYMSAMQTVFANTSKISRAIQALAFCSRFSGDTNTLCLAIAYNASLYVDQKSALNCSQIAAKFENSGDLMVAATGVTFRLKLDSIIGTYQDVPEFTLATPLTPGILQLDSYNYNQAKPFLSRIFTVLGPNPPPPNTPYDVQAHVNCNDGDSGLYLSGAQVKFSVMQNGKLLIAPTVVNVPVGQTAATFTVTPGITPGSTHLVSAELYPAGIDDDLERRDLTVNGEDIIGKYVGTFTTIQTCTASTGDGTYGGSAFIEITDHVNDRIAGTLGDSNSGVTGTITGVAVPNGSGLDISGTVTDVPEPSDISFSGSFSGSIDARNLSYHEQSTLTYYIMSGSDILGVDTCSYDITFFGAR